MAGVKGKTGRHNNRSNQWMNGKERLRTDEAFSFKPKLDIVDAIKADMEQRQLSKTEWLDLAASKMFELPNNTEAAISLLISPVLRDAIATVIGLKQAAIRTEKKKKLNQRDQALIDKWEAEVQELESLL